MISPYCKSILCASLVAILCAAPATHQQELTDASLTRAALPSLNDATLTDASMADDTSKVEAKQQTPERITVLAPKYLRPQSEYHVLVNLLDSQAPARVDIALTGARDSDLEQGDKRSVVVSSGETQTLKFDIGDWPPAEYVLSVRAIAQDNSWNFTQEAVLRYETKTYSAFIQTDKPIYKPGDLVQFRALFVEPQQFAPIKLDAPAINVTVKDPNHNVIKQWLGLGNYRGLLSLDMQLSDDPMLGDYSVFVEARRQATSKTFRVAEYVLPTYEVRVKLPPYITYNESDVSATVEATYTYGKPVSGHVTLTVQPLVRFRNVDTRPLAQRQYKARLDNGRTDFRLNVARDLELQREFFEREIEFFALVEEDLTGRPMNSSSTIKIHDNPIRIEQINEARAFKPGLKYPLLLKIAYQDGKPVDSRDMLELRYKSMGTELGVLRARPKRGLVEFELDVPARVSDSLAPEVKLSPSVILLEAKYRNQIHHLRGLHAFASQSDQYMQLSAPKLNRSDTTASTVSVGDELVLRVQATEPMQQVICQGVSRGDFVWALSRDARNATEFEFSVTMETRMAPEMRVLCSYVRGEGEREVIADGMVLYVDAHSQKLGNANSVDVSVSKSDAKPGQSVGIDVRTRPYAVVGLLGVDQSVLALGGSRNDITRRDLDAERSSYGSSGDRWRDSSSEYASSGSSKREEFWPKDEENSANNAAALIDDTNLVVLTNTLVYAGAPYREARLLGTSAYMRVPETLSPQGINLDRLQYTPDASIVPQTSKSAGDTTNIVVRKHFPETWIWHNATADANGSMEMQAKLPDTITSWSLSAFSLHENHGLAVTGPNAANVRAFRPFFVSLNLPYSIIRGEVLALQAVVFNYDPKRAQSAQVTLDNKRDEFEFVEAANSVDDERVSEAREQVRRVRIAPNDGASVSFLVRPKRLGHIDVRVVAVSELGMGDAIVRKLLVKPEGQTQHRNSAWLVNLSQNGTGTQTRNFSIEVPENAVPDSQKVHVSVVGDILGAGLSNVDDLLRLPYGCGEQNMVNLVPNIVIHKYLSATRRLRPAQHARAKRNIETGYMRQLNYLRRDGSFSAFGDQDKNGSVWLTAYVLKTLSQLSQDPQIGVKVDDKVLQRAARFIAQQANSDGRIDEVGMLHDQRLSSSAGTDNAYLTAYSMIALLQSSGALAQSDALWPVARDDVLDKGLNYLERRVDASDVTTYELVISAYALQLAGGARLSAARTAFERLMARAQTDNSRVWWTLTTKDTNEADKASKDREMLEEDAIAARDSPAVETGIRAARLTEKQAPPPLAPPAVTKTQSAHLFIPEALQVEIAALALLTSVNSKQPVDESMKIARWLIEKQNSNGGYASTQDTVLAIEALSTFASRLSTLPPRIELEVVSPRASQSKRNNVDTLLVTAGNALVQQQLELANNASWVLVRAEGQGSAVVQASWQYNLLVSAEQPAFWLNPQIDKTSNKNYLQLSICTYYKGAGDASNMAVLDVELPSGYVADTEALDGLRRAKSVKRVDTSDGDTRVTIYLDKVTREEQCVTVPAYKAAMVSNNRPVPVHIYDYYNRQHAARIFYEPLAASSCDICDKRDCAASCSSVSTRSTAFKSIHDQRNITAANVLTERFGKLKEQPPASSTTGANQLSAYQMLPLAPVLASLLAVARNLTAN